jgi:pimeloyl-ACP methyl ester carboxylesterase
MPNPQVVILHGWSDKSESFEPLARFLERNGFDAVPIFLGDYISLRNDVTVDDVAKRMDAVIRERMALPESSPDRLGPSFHMVVHSTGGLVARRWVARYHTGADFPLHNLVMLAPANFGSVLAHKGRSVLAKVAKGWHTGLETGNEMLYALELGSSFQWELARADLFAKPGDATAYYGARKIRPFVIVGTFPYDGGIRKLINENGSDGTVRVAAANLNAHGMTLDFTGDPQRLVEPERRPWVRRGGDDQRFPLAVLPDRNHGTVTNPLEDGYARDPEDRGRLGALILEALDVKSPSDYALVLDRWDAITNETRTFAGDSPDAQQHRRDFFVTDGAKDQYFHEHYQVVVRAVDEFGEPIDDYFLAFMPEWKKRKWWGGTKMPDAGVFFHDEVLEHLHRHQRDKANVCLFLDRYDLMRKGGFYDRVDASQVKRLTFTVTAESPGDRVAYFSRAADAQRGLIPLHERESKENRWLQRHCTHFLELVIPRAATPDVFALRPAP